MKLWIAFFFSALVPLPGIAVTFQDDDTVVLLGNTVIERAQKYGHLETALTLASEAERVTFRNLGWSGDTVFGHARSYFGPPSEGFRRLTEDLKQLDPEVVLLCYGAVASFEGPAGLDDFLKGYEALLTMVRTAAEPREIVIMSPLPAESLPAPMPDMTEHNKDLALYSQALREFAARHGVSFADLFGTVGEVEGLTDNGLHLTEKGYQVIAPKFVQALGLEIPDQLTSEEADQLRQAIVAKNKLFFYRWRPANETYLRLFRKHEQGKNVKELPMFDPLIEDAEKEIDALKNTILKPKLK